MVINESNAGFIKGVHPFGKFSKEGMLLSAMSINKGLKKGDDTIHVALFKLKTDVMVEVPYCVAELLK